MLLQAVFPNVMAPEVLEGLRAMTADVFEAVDVPEKMRYQGSSINVLTPQAWEAAGAQEGVLHDPLVAQLNKSPRQLAVAEAIGLENLRGGGALLILSKPAHGTPLAVAGGGGGAGPGRATEVMRRSGRSARAGPAAAGAAGAAAWAMPTTKALAITPAARAAGF